MFEVDPGSWRVHRVLAQANAEADRHVEAIMEYEMAIKLAPTQHGLHEEIGSEYRNANKIPEAEQAFRRELEIDPNNVLAKYKLGAIALEQGDGARGKELIEAALHEKPGLIHADYNLGRAQMLLGEGAAAAEHLGRVGTTGNDGKGAKKGRCEMRTTLPRCPVRERTHEALGAFE